jgi:hypothetical protein
MPCASGESGGKVPEHAALGVFVSTVLIAFD